MTLLAGLRKGPECVWAGAVNIRISFPFTRGALITHFHPQTHIQSCPVCWQMMSYDHKPVPHFLYIRTPSALAAPVLLMSLKLPPGNVITTWVHTHLEALEGREAKSSFLSSLFVSFRQLSSYLMISLINKYKS